MSDDDIRITNSSTSGVVLISSSLDSLSSRQVKAISMPPPPPELLEQDVVPPVGLDDKTLDQYNKMVHLLKLKLQRPFSAPKILMLLAEAVKFMACVKKLSGSDKKDLVLHAVREVIDKSSYISQSEKDQILFLVDTFGDVTIEILVGFGRDMVTFISTNTRKLFMCCRGDKTNHTRSVTLVDVDPELKKYLKLNLQKPFDAPKIIYIVATGVKFIEQYKDLSGAEKKDAVLRIVHDVISESGLLSDADKAKLISLLEMFGDAAIDILIQFGRDKKIFKYGLCCK